MSKEPDDNDGLWTSIYLSSQIFRYKVTQDVTVKTSAWTHFEALELLNKVTGIPGYPARSFAKRTDFPPSPNWYLSPVYPTLQFKDDTSSDEICGHEYVYPLVHDLLANNTDERQRAYTLLFNITNFIITHDWYLVGMNGSHRGLWNPIMITYGTLHIAERGLGSLEILAFLLETYAYSGDERFLNGTKFLIESYQYDVNLINERMLAICNVKFYADETAYLSFFNLVRAINRLISTPILSATQKERALVVIDNLLEYMMIGLDLVALSSNKWRNHHSITCSIVMLVVRLIKLNICSIKVVYRLLNSTAIHCQRMRIWYMQRWPLEHINWPQFNSDRLDVQLNVPAECDIEKAHRPLKILPPDERTVGRWDYNPYDLDGGDGFLEIDPTTFLISYWGMRYFNLLGE